jgi:hypothetical protein
MARATDDFALIDAFDGQITSLPKDLLISPGCIPPQYLTCENERRLYVARLSDTIAGGTLLGGNGGQVCEQLFILFMDGGDHFSAEEFGIASFSPARFYWFSHGSGFRRAIISARTDNKQSLAISAFIGFSDGRFVARPDSGRSGGLRLSTLTIGIETMVTMRWTICLLELVGALVATAERLEVGVARARPDGVHD